MPVDLWRNLARGRGGRRAAPQARAVAAQPGGVVGDDDAPGDSDDVKRFRRFFREHDLSGLPRRPRLATGS